MDTVAARGLLPSVIEGIFEERLLMRRNLEELRRMRRRREGATVAESSPEPTLEAVRKDYEVSPLQQNDEVTELVGLCVWDTFSDNHEVIAADGPRLADIGSFRGAGAFIDEHLTNGDDWWCEGDHLRFYMGTIWIARRADLMPVYAMIFSRLKAVGADWSYHFPHLGLVELPSQHDDRAPSAPDSRSLKVPRRSSMRSVAEPKFKRLRDELEESNAPAREKAMDREPPTIVRAYRQVYGRHPRGWPPA